MQLTFGPIPSRRLGRSLGINNIPPKVCTYSCVYCQAGRTLELTDERRSFYGSDAIAAEVVEREARARALGQPLDHLTFAPDGEPTLDADLGATIALLRTTEVPVAVITNGSLLWREDVRADLSMADWVSVKVDTVDSTPWRRLDRPFGRLDDESVFEGIRTFAREFTGTLATETMLVRGVNDAPDQLRRTAQFIASLGPLTAYLTAPTRPPAERWVKSPPADAIASAHEIFDERIDRVELLISASAIDYGGLTEAAQDLVSICAVHPMPEAAVERLLSQTGTPHSVLDDLLARDVLRETRHDGQRFYVAGWHRRTSARPTAAP